MNHLHSTTLDFKKGQHLTYEHRVLIQVRLGSSKQDIGLFCSSLYFLRERISRET